MDKKKLHLDWSKIPCTLDPVLLYKNCFLQHVLTLFKFYNLSTDTPYLFLITARYMLNTNLKLSYKISLIKYKKNREKIAGFWRFWFITCFFFSLPTFERIKNNNCYELKTKIKNGKLEEARLLILW